MAGHHFTYVGKELELFERAENWKAYFRNQLKPYLIGDVLEVGAGIGATTRVLCDGRQNRWTALEPDESLAEQIHERMARDPFAAPVDVVVGTTASLLGGRTFDAILYIDVLEHIEADAEELNDAAQLLNPRGALLVLSPAHQWLYTPFDRQIGHHRRYSARTLRAAAPRSLVLERMAYLDSVGMLASLGNRFLLRSNMPTARQVWLWDSLLVRLSRWIDPVLGYRVGKSVLGVWRRA